MKQLVGLRVGVDAFAPGRLEGSRQMAPTFIRFGRSRFFRSRFSPFLPYLIFYSPFDLSRVRSHHRIRYLSPNLNLEFITVIKDYPYQIL